MTFDLETLSDLKLTMSEWFTLSSMVASEKDGQTLWDGDHARCDMLVLAGLVKKIDHRLHITECGRDAADAIERMRQSGEANLIVMQEQEFVGLVSMRDLLQLLSMKMRLEPEITSPSR